jgi:hypothetical protein
MKKYKSNNCIKKKLNCSISSNNFGSNIYDSKILLTKSKNFLNINKLNIKRMS